MDAAIQAIPVEMISLEKIGQESSMLMRATVFDETIETYLEAVRDGEDFEPIDVFWDATAGLYWLADGNYRVQAHARAGRLKIKARVHTGSRRDATTFALGANTKHGERRSPEDKAVAVTIALCDAEWKQWSNREIARLCRVSDTFVGDLKKAMCEQTADAQAEEEQYLLYKRRGKIYRQRRQKMSAAEQLKAILRSRKKNVAKAKRLENKELDRQLDKVGRKWQRIADRRGLNEEERRERWEGQLAEHLAKREEATA